MSRAVTAPVSSSDIEALQEVLAGEHAAIWVLGVIGGQVSQKAHETLHDDLSSAYRAHRSRRDQLVARITALGATPVAADASYSLGEVDTTALALAAALQVEQRASAVYADAVARTSGADRGWAVNALVDAAVRQLRFRGSPETFPGTSQLTDL
jgi:hypothetical protein